MKLIPTIAFLAFSATSALAQGGSATVTGGVDTAKNRTSATEAKEDTRAGNKQAVSPANAGNQAAQQQPTRPDQPKAPEDSKPH